ncbi:MAG: hypothetical protein FGM15_05450 [Chthoniobacterales bacterium]|nr:hypothetical protein [Chthoniobacterales bacterium]
MARHPTQYVAIMLAGLLLAPLAVTTASAQSQVPVQMSATDADVARRDMMGTITRQLFAQDPDYAPPSPADADLGEQRLLVPNDRYKAFTLFSNVSEFYTSNAGLTNGGAQSDWFTAMQFGASWVPRITGNLYGEATALQQLYRYATYNGYSFNSLDLGAGLIYLFRELQDLSAFARYNYNLLTDAGSDSSLFYQQTIRLGLNKPFVFSRAHMATLGLASDINLNGYPSYAVRNRFAVLAGYQVNLTRRLQANLFYQLAYFPFPEINRNDWNQVLSFGLAWIFSPRFSVGASVSSSFNDSNENFYDYSVLNTGAGISANYKF